MIPKYALIIAIAMTAPVSLANSAPQSPAQPGSAAVSLVASASGESASNSAPLPYVLDVAALSGTPGYKSRSVARTWAIGSTLAAWGISGLGIALGDSNESLGGTLFFSGLGLSMVMPSAGHFYAGEVGHGILASSVRAAGVVIAAGGFFSGVCFQECDNSGSSALVAVGLGMTVGFGLYDWIDAGRAVDRHNTRVAKSRIQLGVVPMVSRHSTGLMLGGRF
jgi:hypothetical protein